MVLVEHQAVEARLFGIDLFIDIAVIEPGAHDWVIHAVADAQIKALCPHQTCLVVLPGLLGKVPDEHHCPPSCDNSVQGACQDLSDQSKEIRSRLAPGAVPCSRRGHRPPGMALDAQHD